ncbi:MAG: SRPBCC domain-containing protein [Chitinophagaceae bacterium]|nr:SRPBCC domain-containing protein [Chitinophagaceae bacterium]
MTKSIQHTVFFPHNPEVVWEYLTTAELIAQWLMPNDFLPIVGHDFQFRSKPKKEIGFDGINYCKVLEVVPHKRLSYSWKTGPGNGEITLDSIVVWTLIPKDNGTELSLVHSGFKEIENSAIFPLMNEGWLSHIKRIDNLINVSKHGATTA